MKPVAFDYAAPKDIDEAIALLSSDDIGAKIIAGGQSLGPMLNLRLAQPALLVDVRRIPSLSHVLDRGDAVEIGACVTHASIEDGVVPGRVGVFMRRIASDIAYRAIRNRGTIGGSLCHADPAADWVSAMVLLEASLVISGPGGMRTVTAESFMLSAFSTVLDPSELLVSIIVPQMSTSARWTSRKFCRKPGEFAEALACVLVDTHGGVCRAVIGATDGRPHRVSDARMLLDAVDDRGLRCELVRAGLDADPYVAQIQRAVFTRALAELN